MLKFCLVHQQCKIIIFENVTIFAVVKIQHARRCKILIWFRSITKGHNDLKVIAMSLSHLFF